MESGETLLLIIGWVKEEESLSFLVGIISNVLVMEIGWTDVGSVLFENVVLGLSVRCGKSNLNATLESDDTPGEALLNNHWLGNRGGFLSFLVGTISNVLVMEIGWTDVCSQ
jgi:hypothetical protein